VTVAMWHHAAQADAVQVCKLYSLHRQQYVTMQHQRHRSSVQQHSAPGCSKVLLYCNSCKPAEPLPRAPQGPGQ
jgi:hypothetical protein